MVLCATYMMDMTTKEVKKATYSGTYCDNKIVIFKGYMNRSDIAKWLARFQLMANKLVNDKTFKFTTKMWNLPLYQMRRKWKNGSKRLNWSANQTFNFCDMNMRWKEEQLTFDNYTKLNQ